MAAALGVPLLLLVLLEVILRASGFGYPTAFLLNSTNRGEKTFVQNNRFGWRFFGPRAARLPEAISIPRAKPPQTIRIFVFGESAAYGDPQPRFGLPRMLETILELRHPDKKFEVINAAMTGINSHVILPLARDCARADGDVWVIYMGNNEVVGPFGAGTIFGNQATPLPLIRGALMLKTARTGQLLDGLRGATQKTAGQSAEWEGMRSFLNYKLAASDPRLNSVYDNFEQNLKDIIAAGRNRGAKIVLSTVAVNLKDCAPFASLHGPGLADSRLTDWQRSFDAGVKSQESGEIAKAAASYEEAARIDESFAELRFRRGQIALALNNVALAQKEFAAARDLDALRFRCDQKLNDIIRRQAKGDVTLADSEQALAQASPENISGAEFFYEHVHLTFQGNYVLARAIAEKVESALTLPANTSFPSIAECEKRLGHTQRDTQLALSDMIGRLGDVPFTSQANHREQMARLAEASHQLPPADSIESLRDAQSATESSLAQWTKDAFLWEQLGEIKQAQGDLSGAVTAAERSLESVPSSAQCWLLDGILLAQLQKYDKASEAFRQVLTLNPQAVWAGQNLALCLEKLGRRDDAIAEFKHILTVKPEYGTAWLALGQLYEEMSRTNDAAQCYDRALTNRVNQPEDLAMLARFCANRHWMPQAATNFLAAVELSPLDPALRLEAAGALSAVGRHEEAERQFTAAIELAPNQARPHIQLGVEFGQLAKHSQAEQEFRRALQLEPNSNDAQMNLGIALLKQEKLEEALKQFEAVLQRKPDSAAAQHYVQLLKTRVASPAPR